MKISIGLLATLCNDRYKKQLQGCHETWVPECTERGFPVFYLCGSTTDETFERNISNIIHLPEVGDDYQSVFAKHFLGLKYMIKNVPDADFYLIAGTDNYIKIDRLVEKLYKYDPSLPWMIGGYAEYRTMNDYGVMFPTGGSGQILSRAAALLFEPVIDKIVTEWPKLCTDKCQYLLPACDVAMARYCVPLKIPLVREIGLTPNSWHCQLGLNQDRFRTGDDVNDVTVCHYMEYDEMHHCHWYISYPNEYRTVYQIVKKISSGFQSIFNYAKQATSVCLVSCDDSVAMSVVGGLLNSRGKLIVVGDKKYDLIRCLRHQIESLIPISFVDALDEDVDLIVASKIPPVLSTQRLFITDPTVNNVPGFNRQGDIFVRSSL